MATAGVGPGQDMTVEDMTTEELISKNQDERDAARQDLRDTLTAVNAKVERVGEDFRPEQLIRTHPAAASFLAAGFGFLLGSTVKPRGSGPIIIAAALGLAIAMRHPSRTGNDGDREASTTH
jgi:hypothetical protein